MQKLNRMRRTAVLGLGFGLFALGAAAAPAAPQNGREYVTLARPQAVEGGAKIEITEFFGYFCPHCYALEPLLADWMKKHADTVVLKRVHVNFHEVAAQQKLYYTLEAMGKVEEFQIKAFNAFHKERNRLVSDADVMAFAAKAGLDKQKFADIYNSFAINSKLNRAGLQMKDYRIDNVPTLAVDGRYITSPVQAVSAGGVRVTEQEQNEAVLRVLDSLIAKVKQERAAAAPGKAAAKKK